MLRVKVLEKVIVVSKRGKSNIYPTSNNLLA